MGNVSREAEILKKNQKEMLEISSPITEMKNVCGGLISRLDMAEERISELEDMAIETSKTKKQIEKRLKKAEQNIQELLDNYKR